MNEKPELRENHLANLCDLLNQLDNAKIHYRLAYNQEDAVSIEVAVPGQRWEIDCYSNGVIDVEVFKSDGSIRDGRAIAELLRDFAD